MCFVLSTLVQTPSGYSPLRAITVGDQVIGYDPWSGAFGAQVVRTVVDRVVTSVVSLGSLTASLEHPFWTVSDGWVPASGLGRGAALLSARGVRPVREVSFSQGRFRVRNLTVTGTATFFVGAPGVLVHNTPFSGDHLGMSESVCPACGGRMEKAGAVHRKPQRVKSPMGERTVMGPLVQTWVCSSCGNRVDRVVGG